MLISTGAARMRSSNPLLEKNSGFPGNNELYACHRIVDRGRVILAQGYGLADVENSVPATADTVYRIASISKSITATAAMKLVEAGKLDLDAPIQKYCPEFPKKPWPITGRELLSHQSSIRDYRNEEESVNTRHYTSIKEALTQFASDPLEFEPGTKMLYTSYGYIVLGCVIEGASATSYDRYTHQAIFEPAQMAAARLDDVFAIIPHRARGYRLSASGELQNSIFVDVNNEPPGSGINSSARGMGNFVAALYSARLVPDAILDQMLTPTTTRDKKPTIYGLGFFRGGPIGRYRGLQEAGHGGDQQGISSVLYLLPERHFGVVILSNLEGQQSSLDFIELSRKIYDVASSQWVRSRNYHRTIRKAGAVTNFWTHIFSAPPHDLLNFRCTGDANFHAANPASASPRAGGVLALYFAARETKRLPSAMTAVERPVGCVAPEREIIQVCW